MSGSRSHRRARSRPISSSSSESEYGHSSHKLLRREYAPGRSYNIRRQDTSGTLSGHDIEMQTLHDRDRQTRRSPTVGDEDASSLPRFNSGQLGGAGASHRIPYLSDEEQDMESTHIPSEPPASRHNNPPRAPPQEATTASQPGRNSRSGSSRSRSSGSRWTRFLVSSDVTKKGLHTAMQTDAREFFSPEVKGGMHRTHCRGGVLDRGESSVRSFPEGWRGSRKKPSAYILALRAKGLDHPRGLDEIRQAPASPGSKLERGVNWSLSRHRDLQEATMSHLACAGSSSSQTFEQHSC